MTVSIVIWVLCIVDSIGYMFKDFYCWLPRIQEKYVPLGKGIIFIKPHHQRGFSEGIIFPVWNTSFLMLFFFLPSSYLHGNLGNHALLGTSVNYISCLFHFSVLSKENKSPENTLFLMDCCLCIHQGFQLLECVKNETGDVRWHED